MLFLVFVIKWCPKFWKYINTSPPGVCVIPLFEDQRTKERTMVNRTNALPVMVFGGTAESSFFSRCPPGQTTEAAHETDSVYFCFDKKISGARALLSRARPCETALYWNLLLLGRAVENCSCLTQLAFIQGSIIHCPVMWAGLWCALRMPPAISVNKGCLGHQLLTPAPHTHTLCTLVGSRMEKNSILTPDSWNAYQRNDFSEPRL